MKNFLLKSGAGFSYAEGFKPTIVKGMYTDDFKSGRIQVSGKELVKHFPDSFDDDDFLYDFEDFLEVPDEALPDEDYPLLVEVDESKSAYSFTGTGKKIAKAVFHPWDEGANQDGCYEVYYPKKMRGWSFDKKVISVLLSTPVTKEFEATKTTKNPTPRYRKKRIAPPVRKKTDVRISYNNGMRYTITNVLSFILNKDHEDVVSITSLVKGIRTTVELPLKDIGLMKVLTPTGIYDIHNEGYYDSALVVNLTHKLTSACTYFSLSFEGV